LLQAGRNWEGFSNDPYLSGVGMANVRRLALAPPFKLTGPFRPSQECNLQVSRLVQSTSVSLQIAANFKICV
jgi:hypothetical protein